VSFFLQQLPASPCIDDSFHLLRHAELPWVRLSAQVYTDLDDFEYVGKALKEVCEAIERGEHVQDEKGKEGLTGAEEDE